MKKIIFLITLLLFNLNVYAFDNKNETIEEIQARWELESKEYNNSSCDDSCIELFIDKSDVEEIMSLFNMIDEFYIESIN
jgi:hypothetical protein